MTSAPLAGARRLTLSPRAHGATTEVLVGRGLLAQLPALLAEHAPAPTYAVVSDETVAALYGGRVRDALVASGPAAELFAFPAGEENKTPARWAELMEGLAGMGLGRDGCVVAVGGGVTGDLGGFAAAAYARGVALVQVPTSLLAMVDASIGGKTGLDLRGGKNLAGAFHHPILVVADPLVLETLPADELRHGVAEAVKHGAVADVDYLRFLEGSATAILARDPEATDRVVRESARIKVGVVGRDAREAGERAVLNFGHTIGHAIERVTAYSVPHGHAVAVGMMVEARLGERLGLTEGGTAATLGAVLGQFGLPTTLPTGLDLDALAAATRTDKKAREGAARYSLLARIGSPARTPDGAWTHAADRSDVLAALADTRPGTGPAGSSSDRGDEV